MRVAALAAAVSKSSCLGLGLGFGFGLGLGSGLGLGLGLGLGGQLDLRVALEECDAPVRLAAAHALELRSGEQGEGRGGDDGGEAAAERGELRSALVATELLDQIAPGYNQGGVASETQADQGEG